MKRKITIGLLSMILAILIASPMVMAYTYTPTIVYSSDGDCWTIPTEKDFSAKDVYVTSIDVLMYQYPPEGGEIITEVYPYKIGIGSWHLKLWFDTTAEGFPAYANYTKVTGLLDTGDDFSAQGPAWAYRYY